jgi:hypothetical protein
MDDWADLAYAVVDVEGNGQQPPDLVELSVVPVTGGVIGEPANWLVRPARPISRRLAILNERYGQIELDRAGRSHNVDFDPSWRDRLSVVSTRVTALVVARR